MFDITKEDSEDKRLYSIRFESKGQIGYTTAQIAQRNSVHPSKRDRRISTIFVKTGENVMDLSSDNED